MMDVEKQFIEEALHVAETGEAGHWADTSEVTDWRAVAGILADEVRRLRALLDVARTDR